MIHTISRVIDITLPQIKQDVMVSVMDEITKQQLLQLARRLEQVHSQGAVWVAKDVARKLKKLLLPNPVNSLFTPREFEILQHVANGFTNSEIASALDISSKTVQFHLQNIFTKTNTSSRTEAVSFAHKEKLLP
jgi:LuxR family maltose regulon positive regulatory protein